MHEVARFELKSDMFIVLSNDPSPAIASANPNLSGSV
jgi:hypothetical protein